MLLTSYSSSLTVPAGYQRTPYSTLMAISVLNIQPVVPIIVCPPTLTQGGASVKLKATDDNQYLSIIWGKRGKNV